MTSLHLVYRGTRVYGAFVERPIQELPVKNLASQFASSTSIPYNRGRTILHRNAFSLCFGDFFSARVDWKCRTGKKEDQKESGWKLKDHSRSYNKIKQNTRVPDTQKLQIIQLCWEKQREKALKVSVNILIVDMLVRKVRQRWKLITIRYRKSVVSYIASWSSVYNRVRYAVFHGATQLHCRQCHCSCKMVFQNPVLHFPVLHFKALQNGPPYSGPVFSGPPFSALPSAHAQKRLELALKNPTSLFAPATFISYKLKERRLLAYFCTNPFRV